MGVSHASHPSQGVIMSTKGTLIHTIYKSPSERSIRETAMGICQQLGQTDPRFLDPDVCGGLAEFLRVVSHIEVNRLNARTFDTEGGSGVS